MKVKTRLLDALKAYEGHTVMLSSMKGGSGKTTSTMLLGHNFQNQDVSVGFLELDPQHNLQYFAENIGVPVIDPESPTLEEDMDAFDIILIDTAGVDWGLSIKADPSPADYKKHLEPAIKWMNAYMQEVFESTSLILVPAIPDNLTASVTEQTLDRLLEIGISPEKIRCFLTRYNVDKNSRPRGRLEQQYAPWLKTMCKRLKIKVLRHGLPERASYRGLGGDLDRKAASSNFSRRDSIEPANLFLKEVFDLLVKIQKK